MANGRAREVVAADFCRRSAVLAEIPFCITHPGAGIYRIAKFLVCQFLTSYIDGFKPLEFFAVGTATDINLQFIVENLLLLVGLQVVKIAEIESKITVHILANGNGALLAVNDFVGTVFPNCPIHHIQRKTLCERVDDGVALFLLIDELALVGRSHIQAAAIGSHAILVVVFVACRQLTDSDFVKFNLHDLSVLVVCFRVFCCHGQRHFSLCVQLGLACLTTTDE